MNLERTEGQRQELSVYKQLMNNGAVKNPWGRPKLRPKAIVGDKGYNAHWVHDWNHRKHLASVIPKYENQCRKGPFQKDLYRERNLIERTIGHLKDRPSADDMLQQVAATEGTLYGRVDPIHHLKAWLDARTAPYVAYAPLVLRVGLGVAFVYLGVTQKLGDPGRALLVVEKYDLTSVIPVDPGLWVLGAGLVEAGVGLALLVGLFTRASAATAFLMLTLTLFGLPDDPVLAHVTLFGMTSALFTLGSGPYSLDRVLAREDAASAMDAEGDRAAGAD